MLLHLRYLPTEPVIFSTCSPYLQIQYLLLLDIPAPSVSNQIYPKTLQLFEGSKAVLIISRKSLNALLQSLRIASHISMAAHSKGLSALPPIHSFPGVSLCFPGVDACASLKHDIPLALKVVSNLLLLKYKVKNTNP